MDTLTIGQRLIPPCSSNDSRVLSALKDTNFKIKMKELNTFLHFLFISCFTQGGLATLDYTHFEDWLNYPSYEEDLKPNFGIYANAYLEKLNSDNYNGDFLMSSANNHIVERNPRKQSTARDTIFRTLFRGRHRNMGSVVRKWFAPTIHTSAMKENVSAMIPKPKPEKMTETATTTKMPFTPQNKVTKVKESPSPVVQIYIITSGNGRAHTHIGGRYLGIPNGPINGTSQNIYNAKGSAYLSFAGDPRILKKSCVTGGRHDNYRVKRIQPRSDRINKGSSMTFSPRFREQEHDSNYFHFRTRHDSKKL